ncbi:hypothetical protein [Streptomyces sp. NPDC049879]|uniref:hypothetical protein n=1 Tax=Streptomyces sp. NPDC049879 TaxID=3365598 RepID=UPI0037A6EDE7
MHRSIRLALPAVAAASALVLTGCGDDSEPPFGVGAEDIQIPDDSDLPDVPDPEVPGGEEEQPDVPDLGDEDMPDLGDIPGSSPFDGEWYVDPADTDASPNFDIYFGQVSFTDMGAYEGDLCYGTITEDGAITLDECSMYGNDEWTDMSATAEVNDDGTMNVTWSSGATETYQNVA